MKRILILFIPLLCVALQATSQNANDLVFETKSYDFGSFPEDGDNPICHFRFTNQGKERIAIAHVQTTCGCATANYTRQPILPGKSGAISITYNPKGRPGKFSRTILVSLAGVKENVKLNISGMVIPGAVRKDKRFPYVMGDLQLRTTGCRFPPMRGEEQERSIQVINSGKIPLKLQIQSVNPLFTGRLEPEVLPPDSIGEIKISRKADATKAQMKCIRLKEKKTQPTKAGHVFIEINTENCSTGK